MDKSADFIASLTSVSNLTLTGTGAFQFAQFAPKNLRIADLSEAMLIPEIQLEKDLIAAAEEYVNALLDTKLHTDGDRLRARHKFRHLQLKADLCKRVGAPLKKRIISGDEIYSHIDFDKETRASVLVMDVRKSTSMMLKSAPLDFARYLNEMITGFIPIIQSNGGIFEKFTGDGFIALYIESLTPRPVQRAVRTALECRRHFEDFRADRDSIFSSMLTEYGVAFGVDIGTLYVNSMSSEMNIIGQPVVYASRMASGAKDEIILNHQAKLAVEQDHYLSGVLHAVAVKVKGESPHQGWRIPNELDPAGIEL